MYVAFLSSIDLICVCEIGSSSHAETLGNTELLPSPPAGLIFSLPSSLSTWQPHKLLLINSCSHLWCKSVIEKHSCSNDIRHQIVLVGSKQNRARELLC